MKMKIDKMTVEERRKYYNTRINKILSTKEGLIKLAKAFCEGIPLKEAKFITKRKEGAMKEVHKDIGVLGKGIPQLMAEIFNTVLRDDERVDHIVFSKEWIPIIGLNCPLFDLITQKELMEHNLFAFLWGANIFVDWELYDPNVFKVSTRSDEEEGTKYIFHLHPFV